MVRNCWNWIGFFVMSFWCELMIGVSVLVFMCSELIWFWMKLFMMICRLFIVVGNGLFLLNKLLKLNVSVRMVSIVMVIVGMIVIKLKRIINCLCSFVVLKMDLLVCYIVMSCYIMVIMRVIVMILFKISRLDMVWWLGFLFVILCKV